jgi:hypothetical protein
MTNPLLTVNCNRTTRNYGGYRYKMSRNVVKNYSKPRIQLTRNVITLGIWHVCNQNYRTVVHCPTVGGTRVLLLTSLTLRVYHKRNL